MIYGVYYRIDLESRSKQLVLFPKGRDILKAFKALPARNVSVHIVASVTCVAKNSTDLKELEESGETLKSLSSVFVRLKPQTCDCIHLFY